MKKGQTTPAIVGGGGSLGQMACLQRMDPGRKLGEMTGRRWKLRSDANSTDAVQFDIFFWNIDNYYRYMIDRINMHQQLSQDIHEKF